MAHRVRQENGNKFHGKNEAAEKSTTAIVCPPELDKEQAFLMPIQGIEGKSCVISIYRKHQMIPASDLLSSFTFE